jgi:hypothetical protein
MKRIVLSRINVAVVASALSLALATGCSGSGSGSGSDTVSGDKSGGGKESTTAAKVLSKPELQKLIVTKGDLDGYTFKAPGQSEKFAPSKKDIEVVDEKCAPLAYVLTGFAPGDEAAYVNTTAAQVAAPEPSASSTKSLEDMTDEEFEDAMNTIHDALGGVVTIVSLSSYEGDGAQKTMSSVSDAVKGCAGGFKATAKKDTQKFTKVAAEKASGSGDESLAFAVTGGTDGSHVVVHGEVVRHGSTVATYYSLSLAAFADDAKTATYDVPADLIKAQAAKLA